MKEDKTAPRKLESGDPLPIAMPGTHEKFLRFFSKQSLKKSLKILDLGAGHGALTKELYEMGYNVQACDLFPDKYKFDKVSCDYADLTELLPYKDESFDVIVSVEVSEHIMNHENFFSESFRILRNGGVLLISTPNILSLKSRIRFLIRGFYYSFKPLQLNNYDGLQHVSSLTVDQYNYLGIRYGFKPLKYDIDREQKTSKWLLILVQPLIKIDKMLNRFSELHNSRKLLLGRLLFLTFTKNK